MPGDQGTLFDMNTPTHCLYAMTNGFVVKLGQSKDLAQRIRADGQYKGMWAIGKPLPCDCTLQLIKGRWYCDRELRFRDWHDADCVRGTEQYDLFGSTGVYQDLCYIFGADRAAVHVLIALMREWRKRAA